MERKYGMIPSQRLLSHKQYSATKYHTEADLPASVDLRQYCSPVFDQGQQGSCTANSLAGLREYLLIKFGATLTPLSRAFIYYEERAKEGTATQDSGAQPVDGMDTLKSIGVCPESEMPYSDQDYTTVPTDKDVVDAALFKIKEYHSVASLALMKAALAEGNPVVLGIQVYSSFEGDSVAQTGIVPVPDTATETLEGGHCMLVVGYDSNMQANGHTGYALVRNSWSSMWALKGYCWIPFDYLTNTDLCSDLWVGTL
jgi:C1A family cysteine protease